ncbi:MAG: HAMP domain-containing histidine kinase [Gammaproteobacteria bacterium]|nr:HAMP domain-containing histidine kinase [Gammaproteobacteria bacterium]
MQAVKFDKIMISALIYVIWVILYVVVDYHHHKYELYTSLDTRLELAARNFISVIPENFHHKDLDKNSISKEQDLEFIKQFNKYARLNNIHYIYSMILKEDKIYFAASNATAADLEKNNGGFYFYHYDDAAPYVYQVFENKQPSFHEVNNQWGSYRSVFIPFTAKDGTVYVVGADIPSEYIAVRLQDELVKASVISILFILAAIPFFVAYTARIHKSKEIEFKMKTAENANKAKSDFLSTMSHELRTPLNVILGFTQLLMREEKNNSKQDDLKEIYHAGNHLLELINQVLDLSKIESGTEQLSIKIYKLYDLLNDCLLTISPIAMERSIKIVNNVDPMPAYEINVDKTRFRQILLNLFSNAIKYNEEYGKVIIDCVLPDKYNLCLSVSDTGKGLTPEQKSQIFKPFNRAGAENSDINGTGLGLVISKDLIEKMNGSIGFESESGIGSRFWVQVPLAPVKL